MLADNVGSSIEKGSLLSPLIKMHLFHGDFPCDVINKSSPVSSVDLMKYLFAFINAAFCVRHKKRLFDADKTAHDVE